MNITPAIIPESIEDLENKLLQVKGMTKLVQIDICDGRLTSEASWPYVEEYGELAEILGQERGLPLWDKFDFEIDLMVLNPRFDYERWIDAGVSRIIFHFFSSNLEKDIVVLKELIKATKERGVEAGIALNINTPISVIEEFKDDVVCVQFMGIKRVGFQGQPFEESVLERIKESREKYSDIHISVDGGVNFDTAEKLIGAGVDRLVIGSAIFNQGDIREAFNYFHTL